MVNIIDCLRNVTTDRYAMIKIFILTIPAMITTYAVLSGQQFASVTMQLIFCIIFAAVFFETIRRSCAAEPMLLPSFLVPVRMFLTLGLTILAAIPAIAINVGIYIGFMEFLKNYPEIMENQVVFYIISSVLGLITTSIFFASVTQFLDSGKIWDSYNPVKVLYALKTFIVNLLFYVIQDALLVVFVILIPAAVILLLTGYDPMNFFFILWLNLSIILNYLVFADYIGQTKKDSESPYERLF